MARHEYQIEHRVVQVASGRIRNLDVTLQPLALPPTWNKEWLSADVHVHMNYGGTYRNTPAHLVRQAEAEDLDVVFGLVVNKEQRIPDIGYFSPAPDQASTDSVLLSRPGVSHELLGASGPPRSQRSLSDSRLRRLCKHGRCEPLSDQRGDRRSCACAGALVGYVHPFDEMPDPPRRER
jgi:TolB protein